MLILHECYGPRWFRFLNGWINGWVNEWMRLWTLIDRIEVKAPPHQFKVILKLEESNSDSISPSVFELCCGACPETTAHLLGCLCFQLLPLPAHQDFLLQHLNNTKPPTVSSFCPGPVDSKQLLYLLCLPKSATTSEHSHLKLAHFAHDLQATALQVMPAGVCYNI